MSRFSINFPKEMIIRAKRAAFVTKFIILRENKISQAHSVIERLAWNHNTNHLSIANSLECIFKFFGEDNNASKDITKAKEYAKNLPLYFVKEYDARSGSSFLEALLDFEKSVFILFGSEYLKTILGWTPPSFLARNYKPIHIKDVKKFLEALAASSRNSSKNPLAKNNPKKPPVVKIINP